jgi:hypothetical protein
MGHFTDGAVAEGSFEVQNYGEWVPNQMEDVFPTRFCSVSYAVGCDSQPGSCDTAIFVHMLPSEVV